MRFYGWLWEACFGSAPDGIEGWYLNGGLRAPVEPFPDHDEATSALEAVALAMAEGSEGAMAWPLTGEATCDRPGADGVPCPPMRASKPCSTTAAMGVRLFHL